mgnify:FL=1
MAQLVVRNLDEELVALLKKRAAAHGRSAEAEHRLILEEALRAADRADIKDRLRRIRSATAARSAPDSGRISRDRSGRRYFGTKP